VGLFILKLKRAYLADHRLRQGVYQLPTFPTTLGEEAAGIIVGLPSDPNVLNDEDYKQRGFAIGAVAAVVRQIFSSFFCNLDNDIRAILEAMQNTYLSRGELYSPFQKPSHQR